MIDPDYTPGTHLLLDLYGSEAQDSALRLETLLCDAARAAGAHVIATHFKTFEKNGGVTGVVLLAESHISVHTWPELDFMAIDIFMCGAAKPEIARRQIEAALRPLRSEVTVVARGQSYRNQASQPVL